MNFMNLVNVLANDVTCTFNESGSEVTIPGQIVGIISLAVNIIKIVVPILLIIWGMLDLGKAVMAQKEDEIKKGQQTFIKRIVAAAIVFFIVTIVQLVVDLVAGDDGIMNCVSSILKGGN